MGEYTIILSAGIAVGIGLSVMVQLVEHVIKFIYQAMGNS